MGPPGVRVERRKDWKDSGNSHHKDSQWMGPERQQAEFRRNLGALDWGEKTAVTTDL